nr:MAG TPA: holin [Caudoviricetes sp.]
MDLIELAEGVIWLLLVVLATFLIDLWFRRK